MKFSPWTAMLVVTSGLLTGCQDPLARDATNALRQEIVEASQRQIQAVGEDRRVEVAPPNVQLYGERTPGELDRISGPAVYTRLPLQLGRGLDQKPADTLALSLERATRIAARNNLDIQIARIQPAISEAAVVQAEARFDAAFFTDVQFAKTDQPQQAFGLAIPGGTDVQVADTATLRTGIRKPLTTGGEATISTGFDYTNNKTPGVNLTPDPAFATDVLVGITQPLLRNFGEGVNTAEIYLTQNALNRDVLGLHQQLLATMGDVEQVYWQLVAARRTLAIQQRLLEMTEETRDTLLLRAEFDVNPVQTAQAAAFVETRRQEIIQARNRVRLLSDQLKQLLHDPNLPIADETLLVPLDEPIEAPLTFSLLDSVTTALRSRPELRAALLDIEDASIRQSVAQNQLLPVLNLNAQVQWNGLAEDYDESYNELGELRFIDYLIGAQFEQPIGNRAAEAQYRQSRLARQQAVVGYKRAAQDVVLDVKTALRNVETAYELIAVTRAGRRAAAENLRALLEREEKGEALTPEFLLDLKLNTQQRLADAEIRELQAVVDYNIAIARLYQATGTLLERNQIEFAWPEHMFADEQGQRPSSPAGNQPGGVNAAEQRYRREVQGE